MNARFTSTVNRIRKQARSFESLEGRLLLAGDLQISEILAANSSSLETRTRAEPDDRFRGESINPDWIEIQNLTDQMLDLSGHYLSDSRNVPTKWTIPGGTTIPASGFLVVYASGRDIHDPALDETERLHTNFRLNINGGDYLGLIAPDGNVIDEFSSSLAKQFPGISYGKIANDQLAYFQSATPGDSNGAAYSGIVSDTSFSVDRGFYDAPFTVSLSTETEGAEIRYTTDGSEPAADHGTVYSSPVEITTTTNLRAAAFKNDFIPTNVDTHTYVFIDDVVNQPAEIDGFPFGGRVWAGASTYVPQDAEMDPEIVNDPAYSGVIHDALRSVPTMSITSDPHQIFSDEGWYDGENVEESVSVEVIYANDSSQNHQADAGIESHSHDRLKRSLRLNFRSIYGDSEFQTNLFETAPLNEDTATDAVKRIVLRGGNNRSWARIWNPDKTAYTIDEFYRSNQIAMSGYGLRGNYVHLYINGVYWGLYNPVERADEFFTSSYFGGDSSDWFAVSHGGDLAGNDDRYDHLWRTLTRADLNESENYEELKQYLNIDGFSDYLIAAWWMAVSDWPQNNWYGGNRDDSSLLGPSPFQYFAWDGEWSFGQGNASSRDGKAHVHAAFRSSARGSDPISRIWHAARVNPDFVTQFADRVYKHLFNDGAMTEENARARWMTLNNYVRDAVVAESARWGDSMESAGDPTRTRDGDWQREVDRVNSLITGNNAVFIAALRNEGYYPAIDPPNLNQRGGRVPSGFQLSVENPNLIGAVYVTTDGSDPRLAGGAISGSANVVQPGTLLSVTQDTIVKARVYDGETWSALNEASFVVNESTSLRFTEVMYNPHAPSLDEIAAGFNDNDDFEFIELQNVGDVTIDLQGHRFDRGIDFEFPSLKLNAGEFVVVAKSVSAFQARYGEIPAFVLQFDRGTLSNSGERISLQNPVGESILDLDYTDGELWPASADGVGASLQVIDASNLPIERAGKHYRWRGSTDFGGSPGTQGADEIGIIINEVLSGGDGEADSTTDSIELLNRTEGVIDLSGWYLSDSSSDLFKFQIPKGTTLGANEMLVFDESHFNADNATFGFALSSTRGDQVWLVAPTENGQVRSFVDDASFLASRAGESYGRQGRWLAPMTPTLGAENSASRVGPLVISEINYRPAAPNEASLAVYPELTASDLEFVEIHNPGQTSALLTDWRLRGGIEFDFPDELLLPAASSLIVVPFDTDAANNQSQVNAFRAHYAIGDDVLLVGRFSGRLSDEDDIVRLMRPETPADDRPDLVPRTNEDFVVYDALSPWPNVASNGEANSIHRSNVNSFGSAASSWQAAKPNPGASNLAAVVSGDIDNNGTIDARDIDHLCRGVRFGDGDAAFDVNRDGRVNRSDFNHLVRGIMGAVPGDANLDGIFNSSDLDAIFRAGEFEDASEDNSDWSEGDWNCDGDFTSLDLVRAFEVGGFSAASVDANRSQVAAAINDRERDMPVEPHRKPESTNGASVTKPRVKRILE